MNKLILFLLSSLQLLCSAVLGSQTQRNNDAPYWFNSTRNVADLEIVPAITDDEYMNQHKKLSNPSMQLTFFGQLDILAVNPPYEYDTLGQPDLQDVDLPYDYAQARAQAVKDITATQPRTIPTECSEDRVELEVAGAMVVPSRRFPYMVAIQQRQRDGSFRHFCAGTLLTNKLIMTAAHCIFYGQQDFVFNELREDNSKSSGKINGNLDVFATRAPQCRHLAGEDGHVQVIRYFLHPSYDGSSLNGNDIAILEVEQPFDYDGPFVKVWPPVQNQPNVDTRYVVAGWGATNTKEIEDVDHYNENFKEFRMAILKWMDRETCKRKVAQYDDFLAKFVDDSALCFYSRVADACRADSGGPVLLLGPNFYHDIPANDIQLGIVSWGPDETCSGVAGLPGLVTNITKYASWVQSVITLNSEPAPNCTGNLTVFCQPSGETLLSGYQNPQSSAKNCCSSCSALLGCNAWIYCFYKGGCQRADGTRVPNGFCELKQFVGQVQLNCSSGITVWSGYTENRIDTRVLLSPRNPEEIEKFTSLPQL